MGIEKERVQCGEGGLRIGVAVVGDAELIGEALGGGGGFQKRGEGERVFGIVAGGIGTGGRKEEEIGDGRKGIDLGDEVELGEAEVVGGGEFDGDGVIGADAH